MAIKTKKPIMSTFSKLMYGTGSLGYSMVGQTATSLLMFYGTDTHKMSGTLMGIALLLGTIWDGASDPIFGSISDRTKSKFFGRRHGYLFLGTFGIAIVNIVLWSMPLSFPMWLKFIWIASFILIFNTFNTIFQTPYQALGMELSSDYDDRSSIEVFKTIFFLIGMVIPTVLLGVVFSDPAKPEEYQTMAYIGSSIMLISGALAFMGTYNQMPRLNIKSRIGKTENKSIAQIFVDFFHSFKEKNFRSLVLGYAISLMSAAFITSIGMHFFTYTFGFSKTQITLVLGALFLMTVLSQPFWMLISKKIDKKRALIFGVCISLFGILIVGTVFILKIYFSATVSISPMKLLLVGMGVAGFGVGALFSMPGSMMGDVITVEQNKTGINKTGTYNSYMTLAYKLSQSVTSFIAGIMLDIIGFSSEGNSPFVLAMLGWLIIASVIIVLSISIVFYAKYNINKKNLKETIIKLDDIIEE